MRSRSSPAHAIGGEAANRRAARLEAIEHETERCVPILIK
jgi:hypothetical protein